MVQIISGDKGKGKTKYLLDKANTAITTALGDIVYVDKNSSQIHELSNKIRLIDLSRFPIRDMTVSSVLSMVLFPRTTILNRFTLTVSSS